MSDELSAIRGELAAAQTRLAALERERRSRRVPRSRRLKGNVGDQNYEIPPALTHRSTRALSSSASHSTWCSRRQR